MKFFVVHPALKTEMREFLKLALPLSSAQVAQAMTGFVDTVMMGWLGQESLAAGGLAVMVFMSFLMTGIGVLSSVSPLVAEAYGAQQPLRVGRVTRQGLWLALLMAIPSLPVIANLDGLMAVLGQDPSVITLTDTYLDVARWGLLPGLGFAVLRGTVTSLSQARPIMVIVVAANLLNIVGNYLLAFGNLGFPALGIAGLALASALAHTTMCLSLLGYILWHRRGVFKPYRLFHQLHSLEPVVLRSLLKIGLPIGISTILEHGLFTVMTFMMGALGTHVLAAHQLALQTVVVIFMVPLAMSYAATIRVGQWYGQRNWVGVRRAAMVSVSSAIAVMFMAAIIFLTLPEPIISVYLDVNDPINQDVLQIGVTLLTVAGFGQVVDGIQRTANGVLQGLQDTRVPMLLGIFAYWCIGLLLGYWLGFHTPLGGVGIWIGSYVGLAVAAAAYIWRFRVLLVRKSQSSVTFVNG
ncbi:MAG: MATE family efflux transporter [Leptolyngbya sp. SIO1E4]|nr:MATE family efflux transporter [Leptolyngbya sp. SIO1E4]